MVGKSFSVEKLVDLIVILLYLLTFDDNRYSYGQNYRTVFAKFLSSFRFCQNNQHEEFVENLHSFLASKDQCF